jgi:hypothetical protein
LSLIWYRGITSGLASYCWVLLDLGGIQIANTIDSDTSQAQMEVQVPLDASTELDAVAHWGVVAQCGGELGKLAKVLVLKSESVGMACNKFKEGYFIICDLKVESLLPMLLIMIVALVGV